MPASAPTEGVRNVPLVFVPGVFGSHLAEAATTVRDGGGGDADAERPSSSADPKKRVYLTLGVGLGLWTPDLRLPQTWREEEEEGGGSDDESGGRGRRRRWRQDPCGRFAVEEGKCTERIEVCGLAAANVYGPWLDEARAAGRDVRVFAWDWRRQLDEVSEEFEAYLEGVVVGGASEEEEDNDDDNERRRPPAQVVAHSTGGLLVLPALNRRASELFHSVVFAGCPFGPTALAYSWLTFGTSIGMNAKLLRPEVLFTHGVLWNFIPFGTDFDDETGQTIFGEEGKGKEEEGDKEGGRQYSGLLEEDGKSPLSDFDPSKPEDWVKHGLSIFRTKDGGVRGATPEELQHLARALGAAKHFRANMVRSSSESKTQTHPVPVVVLRQSNLDTVQALRRRKRSRNDGWDWQEVRGPTGDGTVNAACTVPPEGVSYRIVEAPAQEHQTLMETPGFVDGVLTELHEEHLALKE